MSEDDIESESPDFGVTIFLNEQPRMITPTTLRVSDLKERLGVAKCDDLVRILKRTPITLSDDDEIEIQGGEEFVSCLPPGGSI